jgi:AcrR family transcriptional regulator
MSRKRAVGSRLGRPPATDSADTRRRILDVSRVVFANRGFDAATNRDLAAGAGLTSGAMYHYFGSKVHLYVAVHDDVQTTVYQRFLEAIDGWATFAGQLEAVLDAAHHMNAEDPSLAQFLGSVRVDIRRSPTLRDALLHSASTREAFFDKIIGLGVQSGVVDPSRRAQVSALVLTVLIGLNDAMSRSTATHRLAVEAIKQLLAGTLIDVAAGQPDRTGSVPSQSLADSTIIP